MNEIIYRDTKSFEAEALEQLFLSVNWSSGKYPDKLKAAMQSSDTVYSAWNGNELVGLINALSDKAMTAYFHYLLVKPEYQGKGIGKKLVSLMLEQYKDCARKVLIAYKDKLEFYKQCGFEAGDSIPMSITYLTT